jgi:hypothetical protein
MALEPNTLKDLLADPKNRIRLDDFVSECIRAFLEATSLSQFPVQGGTVDAAAFVDRIKRYEAALSDLKSIVILIARWGDAEGLLVLEKVFARLAEADKGSNGFKYWISLGWYPLGVLMYCAGIAALSARKFDALKVAFTANAPSSEDGHGPLIIPVTNHMAEIYEAWKWIPDLKNHHTPRSDYLFDTLRSTLEELLLLGSSYENLFDQFEVYAALEYVHVTGREWAPIGRFGWKREHDNVFNPLLEGAKKEAANWAPLRAGLFDGSSEAFLRAVEILKQRLSKTTFW